ncbi:RNA polymerase sigma factor [Telmatospirillum siberiense]|uniref:RNA polymerase sigma factor n=1 Tax=Telmatospirillum siberiense TaxID=382514 RepID=UPI001A7E13B3|nr:RNA polymerase sigma factor [Telmatospirillum siberiense]
MSSFAQHREALLRFLVRKLGNAALAEDLAQETWLRAANADGLAVLDNPRPYLFRIAANLALDHQRHVGYGIEVEATEEVVTAVADPRPSPEEATLQRAEFCRLMEVVNSLSPRCREVFILCRFEGMTQAEVAGKLGISRATVVTHVVHALAAIERAMGPTHRRGEA